MIKDYGLLKHDECQPLNSTTVNISQIANQKYFKLYAQTISEF